MNLDYHEQLKKNPRRIYLLGFAWMFLIPMAIMVPFFKSRGLSMEQIYQLQAFFSASVLILEVPSGYLSDLLGRKGTIIAASFFHGLGFTLFAFADSIWAFLLFEFILALGVSLFSGTDVALLYDSLDAVGDVEGQSKLMGKKVLYYQLGETIAALLGGVLASYYLDLPVQVHAVTAWIPFLLAFSLTEPHREKMDKTTHKENALKIWRHLFIDSPLIRLIMINGMIYGTATLVAVWSFQEHWRIIGVDLKYFGFLWAAINLVVGLSATLANRMEKSLGGASSLVIMGILPIIGYFGMGFFPTFIGILFCFCFQMCRGINMVLIRDAMNARVGGEMRATANSLVSLGTRVAFIIMGPFMGWMMDRPEIGMKAYMVFGFIFVLIFIFVLLPLVAKKAEFRPPS
ncbi:MAG: MFS transporter [Deltaproteobacteria bacterium]|nr:MAG: MFS transporter [Deltaproteobacteria bacterium]